MIFKTGNDTLAVPRGDTGWIIIRQRAGPIALSKVVLEPDRHLQTLTAKDGTYPLNGLHTDGYWYIRRMCSNRA